MVKKKIKIEAIDLDSPDFSEKFAEAIGAEKGDVIEIVSSPHIRPSSMPGPPSLPETKEDWKQLKSMNKTEALERGFGNWDGELMLFPGEWFEHIPEWLEVEDINGEICNWGDEGRDDDIRFGCLAYGVRINIK